MRRTPLIPVAVAALSLLATAFAAPANAAPAEDVVTGLITPLSLAVADDGTVYVAQNFAGMLTKAAPGGDPEVIYTDELGREVGAVSVVGDVVTFATTAMGGPQDARVWNRDGGGSITEVADLWAYEKANNPDSINKYGIGRLKKSCKEKFTKHNRWMLRQKGFKESHPYASTSHEGTTFVADAAANAIFGISGSGVSTVAVLPHTKIALTKKVRRALDLPKCTKGKTYRAEPVPTDVELGPDGNLYVTSLPGGPEDPAVGANGSVYQVNPGTGAVLKVSGGLMSPVGLAIGPDATAYVSMLFPSVIMQQPFGGEPSVFAEVPFPGDVEVKDGYVYATQTDLMNDGSSPPDGKVLRWSLAD